MQPWHCAPHAALRAQLPGPRSRLAAEMMVAGPADDQYNDLLSKEVLQQLGLFGTPADTAEGGAPREVPLLLQQPGGGLSGLSGLSGLGNAAKQVAELLAGTHPSMRGTSLEDWLAADGPVVAITATGLPDAAGGGGQRGGDAAAAAAAVGSPRTGASATPTPLASSTSSAAHNVASSAALSPSVAPPAGRADTASLPSQPAVSGPMALQHQLQLMQAAAAQPTASMLQQLSVQQQQQQQSHILLHTGELVPVPPAGQLFQQVGQPVQPAPAPPAGWQEAPMPAAAAPEGLSLQQQDGQPGLPADLLALLSSISGAGPAAGSHPPTPSGSTAAPEAASVVAVSGDLGAGATPLLAQLLSELSGLQGLELPPVVPAAPLHGASAPAPAPQVSAAAGPTPSLAPSITLGGGLRGMDEDEEEGGGSGLFTAGADSKPTTLKRFSDRRAFGAGLSRPPAGSQQHHAPLLLRVEGRPQATAQHPTCLSGSFFTLAGTSMPRSAIWQPFLRALPRSAPVLLGLAALSPQGATHVPVRMQACPSQHRVSDHPNCPAWCPLRCRQKARISKIESELAKLERDMHQMKLENARLKSKVGGHGAALPCTHALPARWTRLELERGGGGGGGECGWVGWGGAAGVPVPSTPLSAACLPA